MTQISWKDIKFWCWIEVEFPIQITASPNPDLDFLDDLDAKELDSINTFSVPGPQGVQCQPPTPGELYCFELLSYNAEFELNSIPSCNVSVALGRLASDVSTAAEIHYHIDDLRLQLPATVWCLAESLDSSAGGGGGLVHEWPAEKFKIFDGYITGSGFRRTGQGAELTLSLTHWLTDLNFSSALSKQSNPLNPSQFFFPANFVLNEQMATGGFPGGAAALTGPFLVSAQMAMPFFNVLTPFTDLWGGADLPPIAGKPQPNGIKAWLLALTLASRINAAQIQFLATGLTVPLNPVVNSEACRALSRFEPNAVTPLVTDTGYKLGVPLGMPTFNDLNATIAINIGMECGLEMIESYTNVTLWDKLISHFSANYMFSVVPLVDKALVVPYVPGLSSGDDDTLVHRVLKSSDYESIDLQAVLPRPLRAVGVTMSHGNQAGGGQSKNVPATYTSFGGWFDKMVPISDPALLPGDAPVTPDLRYKEGLIMIKEGPKWMSSIIVYSNYTLPSTGAGATLQTVNAVNAGIGSGQLSPEEILTKARPIWDLYARTLYIHEILKNRQGVVTGPVRFDIAPGSSLMVEATEDKFVKQIVFKNVPIDNCDQQYFKYYWCSVLRVSTTIDCQNMRAFTSFYVAHCRNRNENKDVATAIGAHPLWQKCKWAGCSLVEDDAFLPLTTQSCP